MDGSIVHGGKHGLDQLAGFGRRIPQTRGVWESRAIRSEFELYKGNAIPDEYLAYRSVEES